MLTGESICRECPPQVRIEGDLMHKKLFPKLFLIALLLVAVSPIFAQVTPSARQGGPVPLVLGVGFSNYSMDWGPGQRMNGITAWVDLYPLPGALRNLGFEAEGRDINYMRSIPNLREDTGQIGAIYSFSHYLKFHPYAKFLAGIGSMDFPAFPAAPNYHHDTFLITTPGGGAEIQAHQHIWIRADYEYQQWHNVFGPDNSNPNGFTIGAQWDFRRSRSQ
jgi:opacity protein-like surface antigen